MAMDGTRRTMVAINVSGGAAVLASYAHGLATHPALRGAVWGEVPDALRPLYTASMLMATAGYFAFTYFLVFRADASARVGERFDLRIFNWIYALILFPSAAWMPLTFAMLEAPDPVRWLAIRLVLGAVGIGSAALVAALLALRASGPRGAHRLAVAGSAAFAVQTALLDALIWPAYFPTGILDRGG
jgi:hypothetical protein